MQGFEITRDGVRLNSLSAVVVSGDDRRRRSIVSALTAHGVTIAEEFVTYPEGDDLVKAAAHECDIVVVDLDPDREPALFVVETICSQYPTMTVMAYSSSHDPDLLVRCMRAGSREFLREPITSDALPEALVRASARRSESLRSKRIAGKLFVFIGAKGGSGVTTVASNFAIALKEESNQHVALIDVNLHLGDVSVLLGIAPKFNVLDALASGSRMDPELISTLLIDYDPKLSVLAGPDQFHPDGAAEPANIRKLLNIMRVRFSYVVVDGGSALSPHAEMLCESADSIYLVTHAEIPSLRNAQRVLAHLQMQGKPAAEVIVNRFDSRHTDINESQIEKALSAPLKWKLPDDYPLVRRSNDTGAPLILQKSPLSMALRQMALAACGKPAPETKKKKFGVFGL